MAVSRDIIEMLRGWDYKSFSSIVTKEKIEELTKLIEKIDELELNYKNKYEKLQFLAGDKFSLIRKEIFGNYSRGNQGFFSLSNSDEKTREKFLNLSILINDKSNDLTAQEINTMKKEYGELVSKMSELTDSLISLGLDLRGIDTFETIISSRSTSETLTGYFGLNLDELKQLQQNLNIIGVNISQSGDLVLGSRGGLTDIDLNQAIESIIPEGGNQANNYAELFNFMRDNGILNFTGDKNIRISRFTEIIGNQDILSQIYRITETGEKQVNATLFRKLRYYQDTESLLTGNDIMFGGDYEASAKSLRSGGRGFQIAELKTLKNAVDQLQKLSLSEDSYNAEMALFPTAIEKRGWYFETGINAQIDEATNTAANELTQELTPQEDIWITISL